jgi:RNA polymerase sigma-70 factor (ECF subfamily)
MRVSEAIDDQRLHEGLQRGDTRVLAEALEHHRDRLLRAVRIYSDARLARRLSPEDVVQEVYLAAALRLGHYAQDGFTRPYTWLRAVMQQTLIDLHRRHIGAQARDARREVAAVRGGLDATSRALANELSGSITSPSGATMRAETSAILIAAIDQLAPADREVIALRHFEDLGNGGIADILGIEEKAASIRYVRAIRRLKVALEAAGLGLSELHAR